MTPLHTRLEMPCGTIAPALEPDGCEVARKRDARDRRDFGFWIAQRNKHTTESDQDGEPQLDSRKGAQEGSCFKAAEMEGSMAVSPLLLTCPANKPVKQASRICYHWLGADSCTAFGWRLSSTAMVLHII